MLFRGEFDLAAALDVGHLFDDLDAGGFDEVIVDLRDLTFIDSTGMNVISRLERRGRETGHVVTFIRPCPEVLEKFKTAGLAEAFSFIDARDDPPRQRGRLSRSRRPR